MVSLIPIAVLVIAYALGGFAQSSTSASPSAPTGVAIEGDYTGDYRPRIHFTPPKGFMNDPNGLFQDSNGTWHLYYQYNPTDTVAGNQHWGHATSSDLYHWTNQPIALFPPNSTSGVFSGSAVLDPNNTSGFFPNQTDGVVAVYTLNTEYAQVQQIAYSFDGGYTFDQYTANPVIDIGSLQFRDPKVVWYEDHWAMVIAYSEDYTVGVYTSPDLKEWTHTSNISHIGLLGVQYECPNLVLLPIANSSETAWVLTISINPGAPLGGSVTQYFPGTFNGTHFIPIDGATRLSNFAKDDYAGQFFYDSPISIGWASNWQYTNVVPSGEEEGWRSAMTLPRRNYLANATTAGWDLVQEVVDLSPVLGDQLASGSLGNDTTTVHFQTGIYLDVNFTMPDSTISSYAAINFTTSTNSTGEKVRGGYFPESQVTWLDRGKTNFDNVFFTDKFSLTQQAPAERLQLIIDRSVVEVYVDGGVFVGTITAFPDEPFTVFDIQGLELPDGAGVQYGVWELEDTWA
ncbi:hypothetical protein IAR50_005771 [Cryptococcus sp. DSM 104548]